MTGDDRVFHCSPHPTCSSAFASIRITPSAVPIRPTLLGRVGDEKYSHESGSGPNVQRVSRSHSIHYFPSLGLHYPIRRVQSFCVDGEFCSLGDPRKLMTTSLVVVRIPFVVATSLAGQVRAALSWAIDTIGHETR